MQKKYLLLGLLLLFKTSFAQVIISPGRFQIDEPLKLIVCNQLPQASEVSSNTIQIDGKIFTFSSSPGTPSYGTNYSVTNGGQTYSLYFTELVLINIDLNDNKTIDNIITDSDIKGVVVVTDKTGTYNHTSNMNIRIRGASSASFPKKSYRVTLRNETYTSNKNESLLGLRSDKRWLMLAMWNEELKFNNVVSHELWRDIHSLYYQASEPEAISSIRTIYAEAFINKQYRGVYAFTEDMDEKQLQLKNEANGGELYKGDGWNGATTFDNLPALPSAPVELWGGWEYKFPDWEVSTWNKLHSFTDFVKNSSNSMFTSQIDSEIDMTSFIDYFLYLNLTFAFDNTGKNTFLAKYQTGDPYFIVPWDLDGVFGYSWQGVKINRTGEILSNNLYDRLLENNPNDFRNRLAIRWKELRQTNFSQTSLFNKLDSYKNFLENSKVYDREAIIYQTTYNSNFPYYQIANRGDALVYIKDWLEKRLDLLDHYFDPMLTNQPGCDFTITANPSALIVIPNTNVTLTASCSGNDCNGLSYDWEQGQTSLGTGNTISVDAPSTYGKQNFNLTVSKDGCPTRLLQTSYLVNSGEPNIQLLFSIWTPGNSSTRTKIRDVNEGDIILIDNLPPLTNWFVTINNDQITNPSGSNYFNHVNFRLSRPEYLNYGFGPENIVGSDGGPFGIFGREDGAQPTLGKHQLRAEVYNNSDLITSRRVNFTISSTALPVTLTNFKVTAEKNTALLEWQTTEESKSSHFNVQHSKDAKNWNTIAKVESNKESTSLRNYVFTHGTPYPGINYYRLQMVDVDGSYGFSSIKNVRINESLTTFYPNPTQDKVYFANIKTTSKVEIISTLGFVLLTASENLDKGLSLQNLPEGYYILRTTNVNGMTTSDNLLLHR